MAILRMSRDPKTSFIMGDEGICMDIIRIIQVYGIYSFIAILFLALGVKIYWRNKTNRINQMISWCFFTIGAGLFINLVYAPLTDPGPVIVMNILTNYLTCFGLVFLLVGALVIYRSNAAVSDK